jgi:hypothetical protein
VNLGIHGIFGRSVSVAQIPIKLGNLSRNRKVRFPIAIIGASNTREAT